MKKRFFVIVVIFVQLLTACGISPKDQDITDEDFPLRECWSLPLDSRIYRLAVSDDWIAASQSNSITAIDTKTGNILWELSLPVDIDSQLLFLNGNLAVTSSDQMKVVNELGEELSTINFVSPNERVEIVAGYIDYVFVRKVPSWSLEVYHVPTGQLAWEIPVGRGGLSISFDDIKDVVYLTTTSIVRAHNISNGNLIWKIDKNTRTGTFDTDVLYFSAQPLENGDMLQVSAIDVQSLNQLWGAQIPYGVRTTIYNLTVFDNMLLASTNFGLLALNKKDGRELWQSETSEFFYGKPLVINDVIYERGTTSSVIYAISPANGRYLGNLNLEKSSVLSTPQDEYDIVYKADDLLIFPFENTIYAYQPK